MKFEYNGFDLATLGKLVIVAQTGKAMPEDAPNRFEITVRWRLNFHQNTFTENYALAMLGRAAVRRQQAVLKWTDEAGKVWINQTARAVDINWPESPNALAGGTYFQSIDGAFVYVDALTLDEAAFLQATYTPSGAGAAAVDLGSVVALKEEIGVERQGEFVSNRDKSVTRVTIKGRFNGNPLSSLADRRAALIAQAAAMRDGVSAARDGLFNYGTVYANKVVRVDGFSSDIDEAQEGIDWAMSFHFTSFPDETGYAQASFAVSMQEDKESGTVTLELRGNISADSETRARTKWAAMRTSAMASLKNFSCARAVANRTGGDGVDGEVF
jgi:hypothetical protein